MKIGVLLLMVCMSSSMLYGAAVSGTITDAQSASPIGNVEIRINNQTSLQTTSNAAGYFEFDYGTASTRIAPAKQATHPFVMFSGNSIRFTSFTSGSSRVRLFDCKGALAFSSDNRCAAGTWVTLSLPHLADGMYVAELLVPSFCIRQKIFNVNGRIQYRSLLSVQETPSARYFSKKAALTDTLYVYKAGYVPKKISIDGTNAKNLSIQLTATVNGLMAEYFNIGWAFFNDYSMYGPVMVRRVDTAIVFNWGTGVPDPLINNDFFVVRWTGQISPRYSERYTFTTNADDYTRVWVNGVLMVNYWPQDTVTPSKNSDSVLLTTNQKYSIKVEYGEFVNNAFVQVRWKSASQPVQTIPSAYLFLAVPPAPTGLAAIGGDRRVALSWNANNSYSYSVKRRTSLTGSYTTIITGVIGGPTAVSYVDTSVVNNQAYYYVVTGVTPSGESAPSAEVTVSAQTGVHAWADPLVNSSGAINPVAYKRMASHLCSDSGIEYRFGPDFTAYHAQPDTGVPTYWMPTSKWDSYDHNKQGAWYQLGGPPTADPGNYNSTVVQVMYVPDTAGDPGLDRTQGLSYGYNTFVEKPTPDWTAISHPEQWLSQFPPPVRNPVCMARGFGNSVCSPNAVVIFNDGLMGAFGSNTSGMYIYGRLPANKIPTDVAITNINEFALITIWDTLACKGQVAVVALGGAHPGQFWNYEWPELHPGFRNYGNYTFMKVLGYIDIPGMTAPTAITAATNHLGEWVHNPNGDYVLPGVLYLSRDSIRQSFIDGSNKNTYSTAGYAVIISKSEKKAAFLDLQPLFAYFKKMYFGTKSDYLLTVTSGQDSTQWPYGFGVAPEQVPRFVKVVDLPERPTAVNSGLFGTVNEKAYIATQEGSVRIFSLGGLATDSVALPGAINQVGMINVGRNPTTIAYNKKNTQTGIIVLSRGDKRINWITITGTGGTIDNTLRDTRMVDPIWVEDLDAFCTESPIIQVADYKGKQTINYRYGRIRICDAAGTQFGVGQNGTDPYECGGTLSFGGKVFRISSSNIP